MSATSRKRLPSFRGLRALIEHPPGRDRDVLATQLERLGLSARAVDVASSPPWPDVDPSPTIEHWLRHDMLADRAQWQAAEAEGRGPNSESKA